MQRPVVTLLRNNTAMQYLVNDCTLQKGIQRMNTVRRIAYIRHILAIVDITTRIYIVLLVLIFASIKSNADDAFTIPRYVNPRLVTENIRYQLQAYPEDCMLPAYFRRWGVDVTRRWSQLAPNLATPPSLNTIIDNILPDALNDKARYHVAASLFIGGRPPMGTARLDPNTIYREGESPIENEGKVGVYNAITPVHLSIRARNKATTCLLFYVGADIGVLQHGVFSDDVTKSIRPLIVGANRIGKGINADNPFQRTLWIYDSELWNDFSHRVNREQYHSQLEADFATERQANQWRLLERLLGNDAFEFVRHGPNLLRITSYWFSGTGRLVQQDRFARILSYKDNTVSFQFLDDQIMGSIEIINEDTNTLRLDFDKHGYVLRKRVYERSGNISAEGLRVLRNR